MTYHRVWGRTSSLAVANITRKPVHSRNERIALASVTALLDRAYGRSVQAVQSEGEDDMTKLYVLAMKEMRDQEEGAKRVTICGAEIMTTTIDGTEPIDGAAIIEQVHVDREEEGEEW